ncbi:hypothetical protein [Streptomyces sp. B6B3]|uniref:hypothetical protein n=1 Tax=Streptomyces sp. B6B3 TaxID=3153570 RepID=UPI00325C43A2
MASKVHFLPEGIGSLSHGLPPSGSPHEAGRLFVLGSNGVSVAPDADFPLFFGRNELDVHVCVGGDDRNVSRRHGLITRDYARWMLTNTGRRPIRFPDSRLVHGGDQAELPDGYTPLFIVSPRQEHLLEIRVTGPVAPDERGQWPAVHEETTFGEERELSDTEKLVLVCLAQRYLRNEPRPQPLTWAEVAEALNALHPPAPWNEKRAAFVVAKVRRRLSGRDGVPGLVMEEVPPPVGNALNHNLITDLLLTASIEKSDLDLLGD